MKPEDAQKLYSRLAELTEKGEIRWSRLPAHRARQLVPGDSEPTNVFETTFEDATWALSEYEVRRYDGEHDNFYWLPEADLSVLSEERTRAFEFPRTVGFGELLTTVKSKNAGVPELIKRVLKGVG